MPGTYPMDAEAVSGILNKEKIINLPGCPVHPDWLVGVITTLLISGKVPPSDNLGRPNMFFEKTIHYNCPRRPAFEEGKFVSDFNSDEAKKEYCLLKAGCKGQYTFGDCPKRGWNNRTNWCIGAGAPCSGCTQPEFYQAFSPLYDESKDLVVSGSINLGRDSILKRTGILAAIAAGSFIFGQTIGGKSKSKVEKKKNVY
jgi:hydrogenase small subunit